jgi:exonuclease SbcC
LKELELRRKEIEDALKNIDQIRIENKDLNVLLVNIGNNKKEIAILYQTVTDAVQKAKETEEILSHIEKQQNKAEEVRKTLLETLKLYEEIKIKAADVEKKKDIINRIMNSIESSREDIKEVQGKVASAEDKIGSIVKSAKKIEDDIKEAQSSITKLFGDQDRVSYAVDKIVDIENLLMHIEEESKKVQKMRDWVAKLENRLERIKEVQETSLLSRGASRKAVEKEDSQDEDVIKNILRLKEQEWSIEDISKSLKISRAYVELILERYVE